MSLCLQNPCFKSCTPPSPHGCANDSDQTITHYIPNTVLSVLSRDRITHSDIIIIIITTTTITYLLTYLLQLSFHSVAVVLTLITNKNKNT